MIPGRVTGLVCLFALLCLLATAARAENAATPVPLRAWDHGAYGRLVFAWPRSTDHRLTQEGDRLMISFSHPLTAAFDPALARLGDYLKEARLSTDGTGVTLALRHPWRVTSFTDGNAIAIDFHKKDPDKKVSAQPGVKPTSKPSQIAVRFGEHAKFSRVVFDWKKPVGYQIRESEKAIRVVFDAPAVFDLSALRADPPRGVTGARAENKPQRSAVILDLKGVSLRRHFVDGTYVVVDVAPSAARPLAKTPSTSMAKTSSAGPAPLVAATPQIAVAAAERDGRLHLTFPWQGATAAAVFRRAGWTWILFDRPARFDVSALAAFREVFDSRLETVEGETFSALRLGNDGVLYPVVARDGSTWSISFAPRPVPPSHGIGVVTANDNGAPVLRLDVDETVSPFPVDDPEVGDRLYVAPLVTPGYGIAARGRYAQFQLLETAQGVVMASATDDITLQGGEGGLRVAAGGRLYVSDPSLAAALSVPKAEKETSSEMAPNTAPEAEHLLAFDRWAGDTGVPFADRRQQLQQAIIAAPPEARNVHRLALARFYFAHGRTAEARGLLALIAEEDAVLAAAPDVQALVGAAAFLDGDLAAADKAFATPALKKAPEFLLWRAALDAGQKRWEAADKSYREAGDSLFALPDFLRLPLGLPAVETALQQKKHKLAELYLSRLGYAEMSEGERARLAFLRGRALAASGYPEEALKIWEKLEEGRDRETRAAAALARVDLLHDREKIDVDKAIEDLEKMTFTWRGDDIEFTLLRRLGGFYLEKGAYKNALDTLRRATAHFPDHPEAPAVAEVMRTVFADLFAGGKAASLPPLTALSLFREYRELMPDGPAARDAASRFAEYLIEVDLLEQAAALLEHEIDYGLKGLDKAAAGRQLAAIYRRDRAPEKALKALGKTSAPGMPADLLAARRIEEARALSGLGRDDEALALLEGDDSARAHQVRADIHWRREAWDKAGQSLAALVRLAEKEGVFNREDQRRVLQWGVALKLSGDMIRLGEIRRRYLARMEKGPYGADFQILTSAPARELPRSLAGIAQRLEEVGTFEDFLAEYRGRAAMPQTASDDAPAVP